MSKTVKRMLEMRLYKAALEELNSKLIKHEITQKEYDEEAEKLDEHFNPKNYRGKRF